MEAFLFYLAKVAAATAAFYLFYLFIFSRQKQFRFNRWYLSGSFAMSMLIPLITFTVTRSAVDQVVLLPVSSEPTLTAPLTSDHSISLPAILMMVYLAGALLLFIHLVAGHLRVMEIARNSRPETVDGIRIMITDEDVHPFTFFRNIVVPRESTRYHFFPLILRHEKIHADGRHTLDILFSEILFLFQWANPFAWLLKDAVKNNLEYLTDQEVTRRSDLPTYQMALVALAGKRGMAPFLNALNGNDLKKRIIMMKQKTEKSNMAIRRLALLPLLVVLILGLSRKEFRAAPSHLLVKPNPEELNSQENKVQTSSPGDTAINRNKEIVVVGYPLKADTVKKQNKDIVVVGYGMHTAGTNFTGDSVKVRMISKDPGSQPLYILDGLEIESIDGISPDQIESISVLKDQSSVALYGVKGKNGVIVITSKKQEKKAVDALIVIDGKESSIPINEIDPEKISSINIFKGESATKKYGQKGEKGVIEITLKKYPEEMAMSITTTDQLRRHFAQNIRYPVKAQENGEQSLVKVYAFVNGEGVITEITTSAPASGFQKVDEVVVVGYGPSSVSLQQVENSPSLVQEATLQVKKLPDLAIESLKNRWVEFQFKFMLQ